MGIGEAGIADEPGRGRDSVQPEAPTTEADALLRGWVEHHQPEGYEGIQDCSDINDRTEAYLARAASQERPPMATPSHASQVIDVLREVEDVIMSEPWWPRAGAIRRRAVMEKIRARLSRSVASPEPSE
jgi:hypothetical protein